MRPPAKVLKVSQIEGTHEASDDLVNTPDSVVARTPKCNFASLIQSPTEPIPLRVSRELKGHTHTGTHQLNNIVGKLLVDGDPRAHYVKL